MKCELRTKVEVVPMFSPEDINILNDALEVCLRIYEILMKDGEEEDTPAAFTRLEEKVDIASDALIDLLELMKVKE